MPASISTLPSGPVRTATLPPEPSSTADVASQLVRDDRRCRGTVLDQADDASRFRVGLPRRKPTVSSGNRRTAQAAETEIAARQQGSGL